jgi:glycosyltransferase involved in cell wall biosynthesis
MIQNHNNIGIIGVLPPPVTGMTVVTEFMTNHLSHKYDISVYNFLPKGKRPKYLWPLIKGFKTLVACHKLLHWKFKNKIKAIYYPCNSRFGILLDIIIGLLSNILDIKIIVHHHTYSYINKKDNRMAAFTKLLGRNATHIFLCKKMRDSFTEMYNDSIESFVLNNGFMIADSIKTFKELEKRNIEIFKIGHISNLDIEKGLDIVLETFQSLKLLEFNVSLIIGGPLKGNKEKELLESYKKKYPEFIDYRGAVYGEKKNKLFNDMHLLLFPTKYINETYPLVILESISRGIPVITFDRGCIHDMINEKCGFSISTKENFIKWATEYVSIMMNNKRLYYNLSVEALQVAKSIKNDSLEQLNELNNLIRIKIAK